MIDYRSTLIEDEGLKLKPYRDSEGFLTIGVGRNLDAKGITRDEAMFLLDNDIRAAEEGARRLVRCFNYLSDDRKKVLVWMVFQMGENGVSKFKNMLSAVEVGDFHVAAIEMLDSLWSKQTPGRAKKLSVMMRGK